VLVDDGLATGATLIAAARWARAADASRTVAAVPVAACGSVQQVLDEVDLFFCPHIRDDLYAVGIWYADFSPVTDQDVLRLLDEAAARSRRKEPYTAVDSARSNSSRCPSTHSARSPR
jgi:putative phosphoribosyl transferase